MPMAWNVADSLRLKLTQIISNDERPPRTQFSDCLLAKVGKTVVASNVHGARRCPVATDCKSILIEIHVGVRAIGEAKEFAEHTGCRCQNRIGIGALGGLFTHGVEKALP